MLNPEENIPAFSAEYRYAESVFFVQFNDFDFYVEDEGQQNMYFRILSKLFPDVRLETIFPLCGKQNLIAHAKSNTSGRKSVYILDKDFDDLLGKLENLCNLFYLDRYSIENFLLEEVAVVNFVLAERPKLRRNWVLSELAFSTLFDEIVLSLRLLFALFFVVQKYSVAVKSTGYRPDEFSEPKKGEVNSARIDEYHRLVLKRSKQQHLDLNLAEEFDNCRTFFELQKRASFEAANVSGEFILYFLSLRLAKLFGFSAAPDVKSLSYRLAEYCTFVSLNRLKQSVQTYLGI